MYKNTRKEVLGFIKIPTTKKSKKKSVNELIYIKMKKSKKEAG
jgi:hypothetical protein